MKRGVPRLSEEFKRNHPPPPPKGSLRASELRIGNKFQDTKGNIYSVKYSTFRGIEIGSIENEPIPLTEEWLLKFGFEKWTWCDDCAIIPLNFGDHLYCRLFKNEWNIKRLKVGRDKDGVFGKAGSKAILPKGKIKYVHQLQNLYFALTGEELTIKE